MFETDIRAPAGPSLVLGGARSGKSRFSEQIVENTGLRPVYLATAKALDDEMVERIEHHQARRDQRWETVEEPLALVDALRNEVFDGQAVLVDCLTLWVTNLMMADANVERETDDLVSYLASVDLPIVFVSNEVGQGVVPMDRMSRQFVDYSGLLHQKLSNVCAAVWFVTAGLPQQLK
ncbi:MAG: bifunctional adenosylcobinamide kinase/adenosylcobinamide-phosphate guanylyltransferase [Pseudomonadota bacterium]